MLQIGILQFFRFVRSQRWSVIVRSGGRRGIGTGGQGYHGFGVGFGEVELVSVRLLEVVGVDWSGDSGGFVFQD